MHSYRSLFGGGGGGGGGGARGTCGLWLWGRALFSLDDLFINYMNNMMSALWLVATARSMEQLSPRVHIPMRIITVNRSLGDYDS